MKKIFLSVHFAICSLIGLAQRINDIDFRVECFPKLYNKHEPFKLIFSLTNNSQNGIEVPKGLIMVPSTSEQRESLILFEIYYCKQNDTINITNFCRINIGYTNSEKNGKFISENEKYYFEPDINLPIEYFIEKGFYKLRFMIRKQRLGPVQSQDLMTDWIFVEFMDK